MTERDRGVAHALGTGGAHVVLCDVRRDFGTGQANDVRHGNRPEHHGRQQQVEEARVRARRHREDVSLDAEEVLADEAGDEGRHRDEQQRDDQDDRIVPLAFLEAGDCAEHAAEDRLEAERHEGELQGDRERPAYLVDHWLAGECVAEVQRQCVLQEQQILDNKRLVQIVFTADLGCDGLIDWLVAEHRLDWIAWQREYERVYQQCCTKNHGDHLQNTSQKILAHRFLLANSMPVQRGELDTPAVASVIQFVPSLPHALTYVEKKMPHMGYGRCGPPRKSQWPSACNRNTRRGRNQWFRPLPMDGGSCAHTIVNKLSITWTSPGHHLDISS
ncbi:Hypothetical protein BALAC2494_01694 [Bifidobacterium animalis subsp. lactis CNCM I-2494]|uniref:Uncharacterized protein n=1 Tax=Bifidobacterium animalis subsp. lactis CNCM I-2494 TaxID=1042403 RepID=A0A806FWB6_BIFAN|nr:Hypothetical protein BALAC2494_01694 [Bifidobacterium animalis subsp. lactis CNCM I-2494]